MERSRFGSGIFAGVAVAFVIIFGSTVYSGFSYGVFGALSPAAS